MHEFKSALEAAFGIEAAEPAELRIDQLDGRSVGVAPAPVAGCGRGSICRVEQPVMGSICRVEQPVMGSICRVEQPVPASICLVEQPVSVAAVAG
jgi:hypothetical protein